MALNDEGAVISGTYKLGNVPAVLLKYDRDKDYAGIIVYLQREIASLTYLIRERLPKVQVSSHEPTLAEVNERKYKFNLASAGPAGSSGVMIQTWVFSDDDAKNLQANDFLIVDGMYYNGVNAWSTTFSSTSGPKEQVQILSVGNPGSAGGNNTNVSVRRGWGGAPTTGTPGQITTAMNLILGTSASGESSRSRQSIGKNISTDSNYVQLFREPYEASDFEMDEETFYNERPEQINANLASMLLMKKIEFSFWQNWKEKKVDSVSGKTMYTTGGIIPFIPRDTDHQINYGGVLTATGINALANDIAKQGGSVERFLFHGFSFGTALSNAFDNKIQLNQPMSERYNLGIKTIETHVGLRLHLVPSFALTELGYDWEAFCLDFGTPAAPYFQYMYMDDIYVNAGRDGKGIQDNDEFLRKEEFVGKIGLIRRASQYQFHIYGVTQTM